MSGIQPTDCSKLAKNPKNDNDVTIFWHDVIIKFFWGCFVSLVKFSYWSKFHDNIITGSEIITIFFIGDWPEIWKSEITSSEFCPISERLGQVMDTKFGTNVSNKILLNTAKFQGYSSYRFWVIKGKPTGGVGGKITPAPPQLTPRLALINLQCGCNAHMMTNDHKLCLTHSCYPWSRHVPLSSHVKYDQFYKHNMIYILGKQTSKQLTTGLRMALEVW